MADSIPTPLLGAKVVVSTSQLTEVTDAPARNNDDTATHDTAALKEPCQSLSPTRPAEEDPSDRQKKETNKSPQEHGVNSSPNQQPPAELSATAEVTSPQEHGANSSPNQQPPAELSATAEVTAEKLTPHEPAESSNGSAGAHLTTEPIPEVVPPTRTPSTSSGFPVTMTVSGLVGAYAISRFASWKRAQNQAIPDEKLLTSKL
ncbi:hypothetical protein DIPPA_09757 [Diplonema papillatum]|nr:hypothetical protein DIPPA_09757 [Diplonema papillatum]